MPQWTTRRLVLCLAISNWLLGMMKSWAGFSEMWLSPVVVWHLTFTTCCCLRRLGPRPQPLWVLVPMMTTLKCFPPKVWPMFPFCKMGPLLNNTKCQDWHNIIRSWVDVDLFSYIIKSLNEINLDLDNNSIKI